MSSVTLIITQGQQGADAGADHGEQDVVALARRPPGEHQAAAACAAAADAGGAAGQAVHD